MRKVNSDNSERMKTVAFVLKGFPRLSELFIASEIYRLEKAGVPLKLYVIKPADEETHHEVIDRMRTKPEYLPSATSVSGTSLPSWLMKNLPGFLPSLRRVMLRRPLGVSCAAFAAFAQAVRARHSFWSLPRKIYLKEFLQAVALADRLIDASGVRHLHAHFCHGATTVAWLASQITNLPFSFTAHAKDIYCDTLNPSGLLRRKMDAARFVVTCTKANEEYLQRLSATKVHCVYHGLNADFCRLLKLRANGSKRNGHFRVLSVGRLVPKKGFDILIDACAALRDQAVEFRLDIVGEPGEHELEIRRRIANHQLEDHVELRGPLTQDELLSEYRAANVFCLPSRILENGDRDGIPNVLMEAMACGLPVISTRVSGIPEIINHRVNGLLVPPNDSRSLAFALLGLRENPVLADRLSREASRTVSENFDGEKLINHLKALFVEAMQ